jgi:hypothetical protein
VTNLPIGPLESLSGDIGDPCPDPVSPARLRRQLGTLVDLNVAVTAAALRWADGFSPTEALHELQALIDVLERIEANAPIARFTAELCWEVIASDHQASLRSIT